MYNFHSLKSIIKKSKRIVILTHRNSDPDAICSAFALKKLLKRWNPRVSITICAPEGVNKISDKILNQFKIKVEPQPQLKDIDIVFTVDTNNLQQLGSIASVIRELTAPIAVIDHHHPHPSMKKFATFSFCNENSPSTCEIICDFYKESRLTIHRIEAMILLVGILFETRYLRLGTSQTLLIVADLIKQGAKIENLYPILETPMENSEKIARLRCAQRIKIHHIGKWTIVTSRVGSHQASAARAIIMLGADLAIVGSEDKNQLKLSLRSTKDFYQNSGIHLGRDIANPLGEYIQGTGGGHSLAAGVNGFGHLEQVLNKCSEMIKELIVKSSEKRNSPENDLIQEEV